MSRGLKGAPNPLYMLPPGWQAIGRINFILSSFIRRTVGGKYETTMGHLA
jgi:hypothetical protein